MSNDKNKKPPEEAAANNLDANIMLNYFNAAPPMHMDGTPVEDCPGEKEVKKALDSANPIEAFERLTDEDEHIDIPEDAAEWRALIDKISSNPIFKELPFVAQQELQEQAAESLEEAKDALQVLEEFGERDKADRADVERQMLKQARKVLIDNTRLTVSTSTETKDGDAFLYRNLQEDPSSVAVVEGMMKGLITRAARAAAIPLAGYVSMGGQLLPRFTDKDKRKKQAATLKDMTAAVDAETVAAMILEAIPQTFGYFKEHAPERAATLEEYARQEAKAAFASIIEYVEAVNAEPVEEEAPPNEKTLPVNVRHDPIDKHTNNAFRGVLTDKFQNFKMERDKDTKMHPVTSQVRLFIDPEKADDIKLLFGKEIKLTEREQLFYWAMCSIWEAGNPWTTYEQIARVMNCDTKKASNKGKYHKGVSNSFKQEIDTMMAKVGAMRIEAFFGEEIDRFKLKGVKRVTKGNLLYTKVEEHRIDGVYVPDAIHILDRPLLLEYSLARGQIANIPFVLLDPPSKVLKKTPEAVAIGNILIHWLYWKDVYFYELTYEEIYARRGIDPADKSASARMKRKRIRDTVDKWLTYWRNTLQVIPPYRNDLHSIRMKFPKTIGRDRKHTIFTTETIRRLKDM